MTKVGDKIKLTVEARCTVDEHGGSMHFTFQDTCVDVSVDDKKIGEVVGCIGGGVEIRSQDDPHITWYVSGQALWMAFAEAREHGRG